MHSILRGHNQNQYQPQKHNTCTLSQPHQNDTNKQKCISQNVKVEFDPNVIYLDTVNQILNRATYSSIQIGGTSYINKLEYSIGPLSTIDVKFYKKNSAVKYTYQAMENSNTMSVEISSPE